MAKWFQIKLIVILALFNISLNGQGIISLDSAYFSGEKKELHAEIQDFLIDGEREERGGNYIEAFMDYCQAGMLANENNLHTYGTNILMKAIRLRIKFKFEVPDNYTSTANQAYVELCKNLQEEISNESIFWHEEGIKQCIQDKDTLNLLKIYTSYALHFMNKKENDLSLKTVRKALPLAKAFKDTMMYCHNLLDISDLLNKGGHYKEADSICDEGYKLILEFEKKRNNPKEYHWSIFFMELKGFIAYNKKDYLTARYYYTKCFDKIDQLKAQGGQEHLDVRYITTVRAALLENRTGNTEKADSLFKSAHVLLLDPSLRGFNPLFLYSNMLQSLKEIKDYENALFISEQYRNFVSKSFDEARKRQNASLRDLANLNIDIAEKEMMIIEEEQQKKNQKNRIIYLSLGLFLVGVVSLLLIVLNQQKTKNNDELRLKNDLILEQKNEITSSIEYAEKIQQAILPRKEVLQDIIPNSFVFYKPRDIVSGDFYWLQIKGDEILLACADCTGHGVPGAIVSMVGHNGLNTCIKEYGLTEPEDILETLNNYIETTFSKSDTTVNDGMDIALCSINFSKMELKYSGANIPLYLVENGELSVIKPNKQPIGNFDYRQPFESHFVKLKEGMSFFMCSDGYQDQFGGPKGKKFNLKRLKELIIEISKLPSNTQEERINQQFAEWKGKEEQVDDVCFIGFNV